MWCRFESIKSKNFTVDGIKDIVFPLRIIKISQNRYEAWYDVFMELCCHFKFPKIPILNALP